MLERSYRGDKKCQAGITAVSLSGFHCLFADKIGELLRHRPWAVRGWGQWSLQLENTGGGRKSHVLFLSSQLCLYWLFNSWLFPFRAWLVKHLTDHGSWRFPEWFEYTDQIPYQFRLFSTKRNSGQGDERSFLMQKCYCDTSWKNKYLLMSFCVQGVISTGILAWPSLGYWTFNREAFVAMLQYLPSLKQMRITSKASLMLLQVGFLQYWETTNALKNIGPWPEMYIKYNKYFDIQLVTKKEQNCHHRW